MAVSTGTGFDLSFKQLEKEVKAADDALASLLRKYTKLANSIGKKSAKGKQSGLSGELSQMKELEKLLKTISDKNLKLKVDTTNLKKMKNDLSSIIKYVQTLTSQNATSKSAMSYSRSAKGADETRVAVNKLNRARAQEDLNTGKSRRQHAALSNEIDRQKKRYKDLTSTVRNSNASIKSQLGPLGRAIATAFSVSAIQGYINKLIQVRGEFELQQRSLQAILQDKDEADRLWNKTVALAVRSPYRVKELVTYTKQLAAFRIESEKLYDTNKMLADISSGLGVEMNRLILAFGQVKAANYLRGQELRQFSEAGVNILGELSKYFTELEGRTVSVGDVFERVSKRLVSFADVEKVLQRLTTEGGIFYQMQEVHAETLKGKISNLKDSIDIMLNEMGKESEATMKKALDELRDLMKHWRDLVDIVKTLPVKIMAFIGAMNSIGKIKIMGRIASWLPFFNPALSKMDVKIKSISKSTKFLSVVLGGLLKVGRNLVSFLGGGIVLGLLGLLIKKTAEWYLESTKVERELNRLDKALANITKVDVTELDKGVDSYKNLVARLKETNVGSATRLEIMRKINSQYGDYLDFVVDEATSIEQLEGAYATLVSRMKEKASMATFEKGFAEIENTYSELFDHIEKKFKDTFTFILDISQGGAKSEIIPTEKEIDSFLDYLTHNLDKFSEEQLKDLEYRSAVIEESLKIFYDNDNFVMSSAAMESALQYIDVFLKRREEEEKLQQRINNAYEQEVHSRGAMLKIEEARIKYEQRLKEIRDKEVYESNYDKEEAERAAARTYEAAKAHALWDFGQIATDEYYERMKKLFAWEDEWVIPINEAIKREFGDSAQFTKDQWTQILIDLEEQGKGKSGVIAAINDEWKRYTEMLADDISLKSAGVLVEDEDIENTREMIKLYEYLAKLMGVELATKRKIDEGAVESINYRLAEEYRITLEEAEKTHQELLDDSIKKRDEAIKQLDLYNKENKQSILDNEELLAVLKEQVEQYTLRADLLGAYNEDRINPVTVESVNAKVAEDYKIQGLDILKSQAELISQADKNRKDAEALLANYDKAGEKGTTIPQHLIDKAQKDVEQYTLLWELLGGFDEEKKKKPRSNSLYDERIKVITDMNKKFKELNETLDRTTSLQGAFDSYKGAFAKAFEGVSFVPKGVEQMSVEDFVENVFNFPDEDKIVDFLDRLAKEPMKAFEEIKVKLARGEFFLDLQTRIKKDEDKKLTKEIEELFDNVELSKELKDLGFGKDLASAFNIDFLDLDGLREKIDARKDEFIGRGMIERYQEFMDKIDDMENRALIERMKNYSKYLMAGMSESVKIKIEEMKKLQDIEELAEKKNLSEGDKRKMVEGVQKETREATQKQQWEDFKGSEMYSMMFDDIEYLGSKALDVLRGKLVELKGSLSDLPANEVKEIIAQINKIDDVTIARNPFVAYKETMEEIKGMKSEEEYQEDLFNAGKAEEEAQMKIDLIDTVQRKIAMGQIPLREELDLYNAIEATAKERGVTIDDIREEETENVKNAQKSALSATLSLNTYKKSRKEIEEMSNAWGEIGDMVDRTFSAAKELMTTFKVDEASVAAELVDISQALVGAVLQTIQFKLQLAAAGVAAKQAMGIIGYILIAIEAIVALISIIVGSRDKQLQKTIDKHQRQIERLQDAYENLKEAIDEAWSTKQLGEYVSRSKILTEELIKEQDRMIEAQKKKKGATKEGDEEYQALQDMYKEREELLEQQAETMKDVFSTLTDGILDDVASTARDFTDAWYDAFAETGDGLKGLEESFNDMFLNIAKAQAAQNITGQFVNMWEKELKKYIDLDKGDTIFSADEAQKFAGYVKNTLPEMNASLENYFRALEGIIEDANSGELSELSKGIQGVTEQTAQVLESLLNSIRYYSADTNAQIREQTKYVKNIYNLLDGIQSSHPQGGRGLKVVI